MIVDWWNLPGPQGLVARVSSEIRSGKNVLISTPDEFPEGLRKAVRESQELRDLRWHNLKVSAADRRHPLDLLWEEFVFADDTPGQTRSIEQLLGLGILNGMVVWMNGFDSSCLSTLPGFLERFSKALNSVAVFDRLQLCCVIPLAIRGSFTDNVCCAVVDSTPCVGSIDALTYATTLIEERELPSLEAQVAASVVANLCLWDPELANALAKETLEVVLSPVEWLKRWANTRKWHSQLTTENLKCLGLLTMFDSELRLHSAIAASRGEISEIHARVWRGQASVLLPFIEERRRDLLAQLSQLVVLPFRTPYGQIVDAKDLEIGHLYSMFSGTYRIDADVQELMRILRRMRNKLAHFNPVDHSMIESREIRNYRSIVGRSESSTRHATEQL